MFVPEPFSRVEGGADAVVRRSARGLSLDIANVRQPAMKASPPRLAVRLESGATVLAEVRPAKVKGTVNGEKAATLPERMDATEKMIAAGRDAMRSEASNPEAVERYRVQLRALELELRQLTRGREAVDRAPQQDGFSWDERPRSQF